MSPQHIEEMAARAGSFSALETAVENAELPADDKAALWMSAWSQFGPRVQERHARDMLALVVDGAPPHELAAAGRQALDHVAGDTTRSPLDYQTSCLLAERYRAEIEQLAPQTSCADVEEAVEESDLVPEHKTALWLLAWALLGPDAHRERDGRGQPNTRASMRRRGVLARRRLLRLAEPMRVSSISGATPEPPGRG